MKKILILLLIALSFGSMHATVYAEDDISNYTTLREIDKETFNEYRYRITEQFFELRDTFNVEGTIDPVAVERIANLAERSYKFLPDNLKNKNYLQALGTEMRKAVKFPDNEANYTSLVQAISNYLEKVDIQSLKWTVEAIPLRWNAPLTVTLRGKVNDPTGASIPNFNYQWYMNVGGKRVELGRGQSLTYTFREEGNFSVFLDVKSSHKNDAGFTDVLPFSSRADIQVEEKIASLIIKVNGDNLRNNTVLKYTPAEARYGLIFDATSSTPTSGTKFLSTEWDFGNGDEREYDGQPRVERVKYAAEGEYTVTLKLKTNDLKQIERKFTVSIFDPIATIETSQDEGFIGDKFTFKAKPSGNEDNLSYSWEIIDIDNDKIIYNKSWKNFNYTFVNKGKFNAKLTVTEPSGDVDVDTKIIYINSRAPVAAFSHTIPQRNKPNRVFLDGSNSYDADFTDDGKLIYNWYINGTKVNLDNPNTNGSNGYYTFDSIGSQSVNLEVIDPDGIAALEKKDVPVDSVLSVEVFAFPRVIQREGFIKFVAESPEADIFEWDFGDWAKKWWATETITHTYNTSGSFEVKLKVTDKDGNTNTYNKTVYVWDSSVPVAVADVSMNTQEIPEFDGNACNGKWAYVIDRTSNMKFDAKESINIDGTIRNLEYSWRVGNSKFASSTSVSHKFDELGCFPVKLTVKSNTNSKTDVKLMWVDVRNTLPELTSISVDLTNPDGDPLVVNVSAQWAEDPDGVIQSYLWYYYTDVDSEPQDFRSTVKPNTTFVLPKITGNYYFVAILKDNNEAKVNSEEITWSKFFITVTGDNIDTPLVDLSLNDSSLSIGEEVIFTTTAKNILGQDLSKKVTYSWDFDGDGFYDKETTTPSVTHKFDISWTFYSKVKVKHKGISSTKTVTLNVSNVLTPDFDYISIWNKIIFFDTSKWKVETRSWDLGDGTKKDDADFVHTYSDSKPTHKVTLKISEGTKTKEITKTVVRNMKNIITSRRENLNVFTYPEVQDDIITIDDRLTDVYIYAWDSNADIASYAIDYDINIDTDLNGGKDDDEDNKGTASYLDGSITKLELNGAREQAVRVFIKDADGNVIDSEDIKILKTYIEESEEIDPSTIQFEWVNTIEKEKIDRLKGLIVWLDQAQRVEAMSYVQKLQEEWFDDTEKTRVIIDFEAYLDQNTPEIADEAIELLSSLLVEWQEDKSARNISFNALKNLVPEDVTCEKPASYESCYDYIIASLEVINTNESLEDNKMLWSEVLGIVAGVENMTNAQKLDFKAILQSLVYGSVDNIPDSEKEDIINDGSENKKDSWATIDIISTILYWVWVFIWVFLVVAVLYFIYYKLSNKDEDVEFTDFIKKKTWADDEELPSNDNDILSELWWVTDVDTSISESADVLWDMSETKAKSSDASVSKDDSWVPDWLAGNFDSEPEVKSVEKKSEPKVEMPESQADTKSDAPSWLTGETETKTETPKPKPEPRQEKMVEKVEEKPQTSTDTSWVPDWLKWVDELTDTKSEDTSKKPEEKKSDAKQTDSKKPDTQKKQAKNKTEENASKERLIKDEELEVATSLDDSEVPSWLKQDFSKIDGVESKKKPASEKADKKSKKTEAKKKTPKKSVTADVKKTEAKETKKADPDLPDWLADSFVDEKPAKVAPKTEPKPKKTTSKKVAESKPVAKSDVKDAKAPKPNTDTKPTDTKNGSELWDDGMEVPDWLKS